MKIVAAHLSEHKSYFLRRLDISVCWGENKLSKWSILKEGGGLVWNSSYWHINYQMTSETFHLLACTFCPERLYICLSVSHINIILLHDSVMSVYRLTLMFWLTGLWIAVIDTLWGWLLVVLLLQFICFTEFGLKLVSMTQWQDCVHLINTKSG